MTKTDFSPHLLRQTGLKALSLFGYRATSFRLKLAGYNTTFEVKSTTGERFALRVGRPGLNPDHIQAECDWVVALSHLESLRVCTPIQSADGFVVQVNNRLCVLTRWVEGRQRTRCPHMSEAKALGQAMALLHEQAENWTPPVGWSRPVLNDCWGAHPSPLSAEDAQLFTRCEERIQPIIQALFQEGVHVIHGDLHGGNVRYQKDQPVGLIDFDDCAVGHPAQEIGITLFYLRGFPAYERLYQSIKAGYTSVRPWPASRKIIDALVIWRVLSLCASVIAHPDPSVQAWLARVLPRWRRLIVEWLAT